MVVVAVIVADLVVTVMAGRVASVVTFGKSRRVFYAPVIAW